MLVMSLRDVMVIRRPVVLGGMLLFRGLCCWVNPEVLVNMMSWFIIVALSGTICVTTSMVNFVMVMLTQLVVFF